MQKKKKKKLGWEMGSRERWGWGGLGWNERRSVCTGVNWGTKEEWERRMKRKRERQNEGRREHFRATVTASCYCPPGGGETGDLWRCVPALVHVRMRACSSFFKVHVRFARLHVCNVRLPCAR